MRWTLLLLLIGVSAPASAEFDDGLLRWALANSEYGADITLDETIWINLSEVGKIDDYAVRAKDLRSARTSRNRNPEFWVRGYHKLNPDVAHHETRIRYLLNCEEERLQPQFWIAYDDDGKILEQKDAALSEYVVPGSRGAKFIKLFCGAS